MGSAPWGGSEELWAGAALRLLSRGHRVTVHVLAWPADPPRIRELASRAATIVRRPRQASLPAWKRATLRAAGMPASSRAFAAWDRAATDLVIVSQGEVFDGVRVIADCMRRGWPYAPLAQSNAEIFWPSDADVENLRACYRYSKQNFFVSLANWRLLCDQLAMDVPCQLVSNPSTIPFDVDMPMRTADGALRFACVARLDPVAKGHDVLFEVLSRQKWRDRSVHVDFYGSGRCDSLVRSLAERQRLTKIGFHGHVSDIQTVWRDHDALILPSRMEGTPLALIEAMLCSRTAIVTDVGGNTELIENNVNGFVAAGAHPAALDDAMERAWQRREELPALGAAARERVVARIPRDPVGDFADLLERLATHA